MPWGMCRDRRIPVYQIGGDQPCFSLIRMRRVPLASAEIFRLYGIAFGYDTVIEIDHLDADAEIVVVHGIYIRSFLDRRREHREMEIVGLIERAGNDPERTVLILHYFQSGISICGVIPRDDGRVVITLPASVQINANRLIRNDTFGLRSQIFPGVSSVLQLIEISRSAVLIGVFRELPER